MTNLDKAVFANYCDAYSVWAQASMEIQKDGMVVVGPKGTPTVNPYIYVSNKAKEQMMKSLIEMGMTPSSRARVKVVEPQEKEENKRERFFK